MRTARYATGPLTFSVRTDHQRDLSLFDGFERSGHKADVRISISSGPAPTGMFRAGSLESIEEGFLVRSDLLTWSARDDLSSIDVWIHNPPVQKQGFVAMKSMVLDGAPNVRRFALESFTSYAGLWSLLAFGLAGKGAAFVHAGSVMIGESAYVFLGNGGCGKTSLVTYLIDEDPQASYLSEDFGIVSQGTVYYSGKPVTIYASDVRHASPLLRTYVQHLRGVDRLSWTLTRAVRNPRRRASPTHVFEDRCGSSGRIRSAVFLARSARSQPRVRHESSKAFIDRVQLSTLRELTPFFELLNRADSVDLDRSPAGSFDRFTQMHRRALERAFEGVSVAIVEIPRTYAPNQVAEFLRSNELLPDGP